MHLLHYGVLLSRSSVIPWYTSTTGTFFNMSVAVLAVLILSRSSSMLPPLWGSSPLKVMQQHSSCDVFKQFSCANLFSFRRDTARVVCSSRIQHDHSSLQILASQSRIRHTAHSHASNLFPL